MTSTRLLARDEVFSDHGTEVDSAVDLAFFSEEFLEGEVDWVEVGFGDCGFASAGSPVSGVMTGRTKGWIIWSPDHEDIVVRVTGYIMYCFDGAFGVPFVEAGWHALAGCSSGPFSPLPCKNRIHSPTVALRVI